MSDSQLEDSLPALRIEDVLTALNPEQYQAVVSNAQNIRVLAGPGTGKTKTMEARVSYLLSQNVDPQRILALSFTNESSKEFSSRVQGSCGYKGFRVKTGTFHRVQNQTLRKYSEHNFFKTKLGYPDGFFIVDDDDSKKLMKEAINSLPAGLSQYVKASKLKVSDFLSKMSLIRSKCHNATTFAKTLIGSQENVDQWNDLRARLEQDHSHAGLEVASSAFATNQAMSDFLLATVWGNYSKLCRSSHAIDFDDVLLNACFLLRYNADVAGKVAKQYDHVLIDEYQDTNVIQAELVKLLTRSNPAINLYIVGDSRQSIYDFRGAQVSLMTKAQDHFGHFEDHELVTNYRSSAHLIKLNNLHAGNMPNQITTGQLQCGQPSIPNVPSELHHFNSDRDEASWVALKVEQLLANGIQPSEIFVMYRNRTAAKSVESELQAKHVQFQMIGERNFYERTEVRDALALFRTVARPKDILSWARLCDSMPVAMRGIWLREKYLENENVSPIEIIKSRATGANREKIEDWLGYYEVMYSALRMDKVDWVSEYTLEDGIDASPHEIHHLIETNGELRSHFEGWKTGFIEEVISEIREKYKAWVTPTYTKLDQNKAKTKTDVDAQEVTAARLERIDLVFDEVKVRLQSGESLFDAVDDLISRDSKKSEQGSNSVKLLTGHASKGLEAKYCFLVGCDSAIWSRSGQNEETPQELDEASRLYFVMSTRAEIQNFYCMAGQRYMYDKVVDSHPYPLIENHVNDAIALGLVSEFSHGSLSRPADQSGITSSRPSYRVRPGNPMTSRVKSSFSEKRRQSNSSDTRFTATAATFGK